MISVNWWTQVISVPQSYLTSLGGDSYELDVDVFRLALKDLEDDEGMPFVDTHSHVGEITLAGVTYARFVEIINGYTIEFEDGTYEVNLVGANNNVIDVKVVNSVSVIANNSAGLVSVQGVDQATLQRVLDILEGDQEYRPATYRILDKGDQSELVSKDVTLVTPGTPSDGVDFTEP
jgi:hypothetical protein